MEVGGGEGRGIGEGGGVGDGDRSGVCSGGGVGDGGGDDSLVDGPGEKNVMLNFNI